MRKGFTLIELLVVIAVIAILAALIFPLFARVRQRGHQAKCISNLKQIGAAVELYRQDYNDCYPWATVPSAYHALLYKDLGMTSYFLDPNYVRTLEELLRPFIKSEQVWYCTANAPDEVIQKRLAGVSRDFTFLDNKGSYFWNYRTPVNAPELAGRPEVIISGLNPSEKFHEGSKVGVLFDIRQWGADATATTPAAPHNRGICVWFADMHAEWVPLYGMKGQNASTNYYRAKSWLGIYSQ